MTEKEVLLMAVSVYGDDQDEMVIEEATEVIHAIQKLKRAKKRGNDTEIYEAREHLVGEFVDLEIVLEQMKIKYPFHALRKRIRATKIERLAKKLGEGGNRE